MTSRVRDEVHDVRDQVFSGGERSRPSRFARHSVAMGSCAMSAV